MEMDLNYDSVIIEKAKQGNEKAWAMLFKANFKPLYCFCLQLVLGRESDAEEIAQQTFIIAAKKVHKFDPSKGSFRQWLFGIAKNCYRKHLSKNKLVASCSTDQIKDVPMEPANTFLENRLVLEVLAQLPAHQRTILEAKYFNKRSMAQLAEDHGVTINAIGLRLSRARDKFKQKYQALQKKQYEI